jgi:hypothetical protein
MTIFRHSLLLLIPALTISVDVARAHHSFAAVYDQKRTITVDGVVTEFRLVNPHSLMSIDVTEPSGRVVKWTVEFDGRLNLTEGGWTERSIVAGERITVTGNPTHIDSPRLFFRRLMRPNGIEIVRPMDAQENTIDEQRRRAREKQPAAVNPP